MVNSTTTKSQTAATSSPLPPPPPTTTTTTMESDPESLPLPPPPSKPSSAKKRVTITEFVESSFASIERLCNPISNAGEHQATQTGKSSSSSSSSSSSKTNTHSASAVTDTVAASASASASVNNSKSKTSSSTSSSSSSSSLSNRNKNNNSNLDDEDEDEEAYATLTYLALLTSLYLPLLLFLWIRRSIFGTASLCRSLFLGHMLRLVLAFMLLPPSTTKAFVPTWLWNFGVTVGNTAEKLWNDKRTQAMIPTWFHLVLAFLLGIENENVPSSAALANLGSNNEKDTWPPPALVILGIFTISAFVVHPDGLTWIMVAHIKNWIVNAFEKTTEGIQMMRDGTIKITLAELSGVIAGIIIIVTIVRAILSQLEPTEKARTPHREKKGHKHRKGKKGKGGRHHHHHNNHNNGNSNSNSNNQKTSTSEGNGGKGRIRSGHYRAAKDLYESTPRSRSPSPSGRARSDSDMEDTTVSALSDSGNAASFESTTKQISEKKTSKNVGTENSSSNVGQRQNKPSKQSSPARENQKSGESSEQVGKKEPKVSPARENKKSVQPSSSPASGQPGRRTQVTTSGEKQKRGHGRKGKKSKHHSNFNSADSTKSNDSNPKASNTPNRQVKSNGKSRKNNREDRYHNKNFKARETECDATVGSTASCGNSDHQNYPNSPLFSSHRGTEPIRENEYVHGATHNRRRSFTDPSASLPQSQVASTPSIYQQSLNIPERNVVTPPSQMPLSSENRDLFTFHQLQQANQNRNFASNHSSNINGGLYALGPSDMVGDASQRYEIGLFGHNQLDVQRVNQNTTSHGSPNLRGLNGSMIRPPPGLGPSQNSVGSSSVFAHDLNDSSQQTLPSLSSSSISIYSSLNSNAPRDVYFNNSQSSGDHFNAPPSNVESSRRNIGLPSISPIHRSAPAPIGHERAMKLSNDEEIEADLLALGGQMAGSILDF
eukprot:CAMPEP_0203673474 /NCGR_PEP_ID=MMETSP0090-20130426/12668_1 /ASSEMBLY_ACC=CAM_ASM_001088 /TAXON_ID=426623 /ORGANISM="Chaetoceros affinis, Strain CCMP159" /LENGTH=942 /DNA_ID=CAMNT_0050539147 /DNA_START=400 /DNA_END=3228 /DNA_ORIENTATION=+